MNRNDREDVSFETKLYLDPERVQNFEELMGREKYAVESGDSLKPGFHWLAEADTNTALNESLKKRFEADGRFWTSGNIELEHPLYLGESCKETVFVSDQSEREDEGGPTRITVKKNLYGRGKISIREIQNLAFTDNPQALGQARRINFEPDWEQKVPESQLDKVRKLQGTVYGHNVSDLFSTTSDSEPSEPSEPSEKLFTVQGSPALLLLVESFNYHFESRIIEKMSYEAHSFNPESDISIAGEDSDAYVTSLRIINSKRQVLFSADFRWAYNW